MNQSKFMQLLIGEVYRYLMVASACLVCLAHGSNDVANAISPLIVVLRVEKLSISWAYQLGGLGIALGLLFLGFRVMETVGKNVIKLDFYKGFSGQIATATSVIFGSSLGLPLSTTHCMIGALVGIALTSKLPIIKKTYANFIPEQIAKEEVEQIEPVQNEPAV
jgi:phosphate/sulfate permease